MNDPQSSVERNDKSVAESEWPVERLMRLAERARFFRSADGRLFARVPVEGRSEIHGLKSGAFREWLIGGYFREWRALPSNAAVRRVLGEFEAFARFEGDGRLAILIRTTEANQASSARRFI
jgi:hypothetical protein